MARRTVVFPHPLGPADKRLAPANSQGKSSNDWCIIVLTAHLIQLQHDCIAHWSVAHDPCAFCGVGMTSRVFDCSRLSDVQFHEGAFRDILDQTDLRLGLADSKRRSRVRVLLPGSATMKFCISVQRCTFTNRSDGMGTSNGHPCERYSQVSFRPTEYHSHLDHGGLSPGSVPHPRGATFRPDRTQILRCLVYRAAGMVTHRVACILLAALS